MFPPSLIPLATDGSSHPPVPGSEPGKLGLWPGHDKFLAILDRKFGQEREETLEPLWAWVELLDAAGWPVALQQSGGAPWLGTAARKDLMDRGNIPATWLDLIAMLDQIPSQHRHLDGKCVQVWCDSPANVGMPPAGKLTSREVEIFNWLRKGKTCPEIAIILSCAVRTVEKHVANGYRKLGLNNRASVIIHSPPSTDQSR
jgi:DNA-binding CsgD family transcriptional regulator